MMELTVKVEIEEASADDELLDRDVAVGIVRGNELEGGIVSDWINPVGTVSLSLRKPFLKVQIREIPFSAEGAVMVERESNCPKLEISEHLAHRGYHAHFSNCHCCRRKISESPSNIGSSISPNKAVYALASPIRCSPNNSGTIFGKSQGTIYGIKQ